MAKIELEIIALTHSMTQSHSFSVILGEVGGTRRLPIVIGGSEAQSIAVALDNITPSRPLTHDLFKTLCDTFLVNIIEVKIVKLIDGIFYSVLICTNDYGMYEIDSRTSDALAIAVRFDCPIYVENEILKEAGIDVDSDQPKDELEETLQQAIESITAPPPAAGNNYGHLSAEQLEEELNNAIEDEDYEKAARIRDELNKRK